MMFYNRIVFAANYGKMPELIVATDARMNNLLSDSKTAKSHDSESSISALPK